VILDVMPLDQEILGFSNRWYREAMHAATVLTLEPSLQIRSITAPFFLATKLEAFKGRGWTRLFCQPRSGRCDFGDRWPSGVVGRGASHLG
jgi:hypothetical protein